MSKNLKFVPIISLIILYFVIYRSNIFDEFFKVIIAVLFAIINTFIVLYSVKSKQIPKPNYVLLLVVLIGTITIFIIGIKQIDK